MDSLCFLCSLEEIIGELSTLPIGLDQAYVIFRVISPRAALLKQTDTAEYWNESICGLQTETANKQNGFLPG